MTAGMSCDLRRLAVPLRPVVQLSYGYGLFADLQTLLIHLAQVELATGHYTVH